MTSSVNTIATTAQSAVRFSIFHKKNLKSQDFLYYSVSRHFA